METNVRSCIYIISKNFPGLYVINPGPPLNRGGEGGKGREERGGKGMELGGNAASICTRLKK
jgi:hypothetical protein